MFSLHSCIFLSMYIYIFFGGGGEGDGGGQREWFQTVGVHSVFSVCRKRQRQGSGSKNLTGTTQQVFEWEAIFGSIIFVNFFFVWFIFIFAKKWGGGIKVPQPLPLCSPCLKGVEMFQNQTSLDFGFHRLVSLPSRLGTNDVYLQWQSWDTFELFTPKIKSVILLTVCQTSVIQFL